MNGKVMILIMALLTLSFTSAALAKTKMEKLTTSSEGTDWVDDDPAWHEDYPQRHVFYFGPAQTYLHGQIAKLGHDQKKNEFYYLYRAGARAGFMLNIHWHKFARANHKLELIDLAPAFKFNLYRYEVVDAYVLGGLGFYRLGRQDDRQDWQRKWVLGWHVGTGVNLSVSQRINYAIQGHYHYPFKATTDNGTKISGTYWSVAMLLGLAF